MTDYIAFYIENDEEMKQYKFVKDTLLLNFFPCNSTLNCHFFSNEIKQEILISLLND